MSPPSPLDPENWRALDDSARDGRCQLVRDRKEFALAKWDGERFVYPNTDRVLTIEPTEYFIGGSRG